MKKLFTTSFSAFLIYLVQGCASVAVTGDDLSTNTARAIGVSPSSVSISDRVDSGIKTTYTAEANGNVYNCYVTGSLTVAGRVVSDAMCTPLASAKSQSQPSSNSSSCNALLKSAGKC